MVWYCKLSYRAAVPHKEDGIATRTAASPAFVTAAGSHRVSDPLPSLCDPASLDRDSASDQLDRQFNNVLVSLIFVTGSVFLANILGGLLASYSHLLEDCYLFC